MSDERKVPAPKPKSWASMALANRRPRGCDGQFVSRKFAREAERIGEQLREVRAKEPRE